MEMIRALAIPFRKTLDMLQNLTSYVCALAMLAIGFLMFFMVIARYFFDYTPFWGQLALTWTLTWAIFLIAGSVSRKNQHIGIGFFANSIFKSKARVVKYATENIVGVIFCSYMAWHSWEWVERTKDMGLIEFVGTHTYDAWLPILVLPMGFIIATLFYFERFIRQLYGLYGWLSKNKLESSTNIENQQRGNHDGQ